MPKNVAFKDLQEDALFLTEDFASNLVLYRKQGQTGAPYSRYDGIRHGVLGFYPQREHPEFRPDQLVYLLAYEDERD